MSRVYYRQISNSHKVRISQKNSKKWKLISPLGKTYYVKNLYKWIKENNLPLYVECFSMIVHGKMNNYHKGWQVFLLDEFPNGAWVNKPVNKKDSEIPVGRYKITDMNSGRVIIVETMTNFARENGISTNTLREYLRKGGYTEKRRYPYKVEIEYFEVN